MSSEDIVKLTIIVLQVDNDLKKENADRLLKQALDFDKPGEGQHYCIHCA